MKPENKRLLIDALKYAEWDKKSNIKRETERLAMSGEWASPGDNAAEILAKEIRRIQRSHPPYKIIHEVESNEITPCGKIVGVKTGKVVTVLAVARPWAMVKCKGMNPYVAKLEQLKLINE